MTNFNPELIEKAKAAQSVEELLALAKENGGELTEEEAKTYFAQINREGAVSDDELDTIVGGGCFDDDDSEGSNLHTAASLPFGSFAEVTDGKTCPGCGATRGIVKSTRMYDDFTDTQMGVYCTKCLQWITTTATKDSVVKL